MLAFVFDSPIPLPLLGARWEHPARLGEYAATITVHHVAAPSEQQARVGGASIRGRGRHYHTYDRFGVYSSSRVEVALRCHIEDLIDLGLLDVLGVDTPGQLDATLGMVLVAAAGREVLASLFNSVVDAYCMAFARHEILQVTPSDILSVRLVELRPDGTRAEITRGMGVEGETWIMGAPPEGDRDGVVRVHEELMRFPLQTWEELLLSAHRDLAVGRIRGAAMHLCLSTETFLSCVLRSNEEFLPGKRYSPLTFKPMGVKGNGIRSLIGCALDAKELGEVRDAFIRLAELRDSVMHSGRPEYRWAQVGGTSVEEVISDRDGVVEHLRLAEILRNEVARRLLERGRSVPGWRVSKEGRRPAI